MENIKKIFECQLCRDLLKNCILLPCGETVCQDHFLNISKISCPICRNGHEVPVDGFPINKIANKLIDSSIHELDLGEAFNSTEICCLKLEETFEFYFKLLEKPWEYAIQFLEQMIQSLDLKREEVKLENNNHVRNLVNEFLDSKLKVNNDSKDIRIESYLKLAKIELASTENPSSLMENAKTVINEKIDQRYFSFIDELNKCLKKFSTLSDKEKELYVLDDKYQQEMKKMYDELQNLSNTIKKLKFKEKNFPEIRKNFDGNKAYINNILRYMKNKILLNKGFDFESKLYYFPHLDDSEFLKSKNFYEFVLNVKNFSLLDLEPVKSEKFVVNGIKFYVVLKIQKNKIGIFSYVGCLICENTFNFCGIKVEYSMQLTPFMNAPKLKKSVINFFSPGYFKLAPLNGASKTENLRLFVKVQILGLRMRNLTALKPKNLPKKTN